MLEDERKLILEAKGGEAEAFGRLYDFYLPAIYRFILLKVGQREEAEDLAHQVFLKAWQNISGFSEKGLPFSSWLYRIARNLIIDRYRRTKPVISIDEEFVSEKLIFRPDISDIDDRKDIARIMASLHELKDIERDVIIMRFIEDLSVKEVSETINKSEGAVKLIQHRALQKIRTILNEK
ncbi:MAG: sigma-70 family RNA polymerase sigma factor [Parcubacteria group bacterium]